MMGYTMDTFVAELRCPRCGQTSPADSSTVMHTHMRRDPQLAWLNRPIQARAEPVRDGKIESITNVPLSLETLDRAHWIDDDVLYVAEALADRDLRGLQSDELLALLRERLP